MWQLPHFIVGSAFGLLPMHIQARRVSSVRMQPTPSTDRALWYKGGGDYFCITSLAVTPEIPAAIAKASMALLRAIFATNT